MQRLVWILPSTLRSFPSRVRFKYVCNRTTSVAAVDRIDKMEITLIFEKKEKWKNDLTALWALFFASELEVDR